MGALSLMSVTVISTFAVVLRRGVPQSLACTTRLNDDTTSPWQRMQDTCVSCVSVECLLVLHSALVVIFVF